jgi:probable rRNA maturation factor
MNLAVDIIVSSPPWEGMDDFARRDGLVERALYQCVATTGARLAQDSEVCVTFCNDETIHRLNAQWRGADTATNVLSFPTPGPLAKKNLLGDIVIAYETVAREAREQDKSLRDHVAHMVVHGFLHLIGYDHETSAEAEIMEAAERRVAAALGLSDPYEGTLLADKDFEPNGSEKANVDEA